MPDLKDSEGIPAKNPSALGSISSFLGSMGQLNPSFAGIRMPPDPTAAHYASKFYEYLSEMINEFNAELDNEHEVGACLASFGAGINFHITGLGYQNPSLIILYGENEEGEPVQLVQHVSQINVLLMKLKRKNPEEPKKPIGYHAETQGGPQT